MSKKIVHKKNATAAQRGGIRTQLYTSGRGKKVRFTPMPPMLLARIEQQVNAEFGDNVPPTYTLDAIGGKEIHDHTEATLDTDEDRLAWATYQARDGQRQERASSLILRALQIECLEPIIDEDDDWIDRMEFMGLPVPDGKYDRQLMWVESQFIGGEDDIMACMQIPMQLAGVSQEDMAAAETMFRDTVQETAA